MVLRAVLSEAVLHRQVGGPDVMREQVARSTSSSDQGGNCLEVSDLGHGRRAVRDSKNPTGPTLMVTAAEWTAFTAGVRADEFDLAR